MGLFSRKKKFEVPLPPSEDLLRFPRPPKAEREIRPEKIPEAAAQEISLPESPLPRLSSKFFRGSGLPPSVPSPFVLPGKLSLAPEAPFFLRFSHYQILLQNLNEARSRALEMAQLGENLEKSEFNEDKNYEELKNNLKKIHDRLLFMDDLIFKK